MAPRPESSHATPSARGRSGRARREARSTCCSTRPRSTSSTTPEGDALEQRAGRGAREARPRVNVLVSLREDALAKLDRFKGSIPGILDNYLRLDRLSREAGRAAVERAARPLARARRRADRDRAGARRGRARPGRGGADPRADSVAAARWQTETARGADRGALPPARDGAALGGRASSRARPTLRATTLEQLGGAAQIVAAHLERAMAALTPAQQAIASALLRQLVTPSGAKIATPPSDLAGYAGVPEDEVRRRARRARGPADPASRRRRAATRSTTTSSPAPILGWRARYVHAAGARRGPPAQPQARARRHGGDRGARRSRR